MKPIAIFRHARTEGPGYLGDYLDQQGIPWQLIRIDRGDALPPSASAYSGLVFMGGPMSVNDDLPWIPLVLELIREAVTQDVPVLGHCLGGQLMAKALGGTVGANPVKEIGWGEVRADAHEEARRWFGEKTTFPVFHWHGETFSLPDGATHLLSSPYCENQAFSLGKHLAFQCHIEMTAPMVREWCDVGADELASAAASPGVQSASEILGNLEARVAELNALAAAVYQVWLEGVHASRGPLAGA